MTEGSGEMIELTVRVPAEKLLPALSAAVRALAGTEDRGEPAAENPAFREEVFRRLARETEKTFETAPGTVLEAMPWAAAGRKAPAPDSTDAAEQGAPEHRRDGAAARGDGPEESTAEDVPRRQTAALPEELAARAGTGEPVLPERAARSGADIPARRGIGTAGGRLSAPEPASYAAALPAPATGRQGGAPERAEERSGGPALSAEEMSRRWERDSRRYDGGFALY